MWKRNHTTLPLIGWNKACKYGVCTPKCVQRTLLNHQQRKGIEKSKIVVGIVKKQYARVNHGRANTVFHRVWLFAVLWWIAQNGEVDCQLFRCRGCRVQQKLLYRLVFIKKIHFHRDIFRHTSWKMVWNIYYVMRKWDRDDNFNSETTYPSISAEWPSLTVSALIGCWCDAMHGTAFLWGKNINLSWWSCIVW